MPMRQVTSALLARQALAGAKAACVLVLSLCSACITGPANLEPTPTTSLDSIDATIAAAMAHTQSRGMAVAVVDRGQVVFTKAWGVRDASGASLQTDTVMYGASLTKAAFGYLVMQLVEEGRLDLDRPLGEYLPEPLPSYTSADTVRRYTSFAGLVNDPRWRSITARHVLTHSAGFANFYFLEPDETLKIHFDPGTRYAYSGDGLITLQFVLEQGLGIDVGAEMTRRIFQPNNMVRTSLIWRDDFRPNLADGFTQDGSVEPHDERSRVRASGSMDTTITDMGRLAAAYIRGDGLSPAGRRALVQSHLQINTPSQFPSLRPGLDPAPFPNLGAGLGVVAFDGPQGHGFYKGGHNDSTANTWVCIEAGLRCVVILSNDVRSEAAFPAIIASILGETGLPWAWEYSTIEFWRP